MLGLLGAATATWVLSPKIGEQTTQFMHEVFRADIAAHADLGSGDFLHNILMRAVNIILFLGAPIAFAGFAVGAIASFAQIGAIFTTDPLTPDLNKINPLEGLKRMFSLKSLTEGARLIVKMTVALLVAYGLVKSEIIRSSSYVASEPTTILAAYGEVAKGVFLTLISVLGVFAGIDFGLQKWEYSKSLKMTKQEAKQEHKEREGDPQIRARIRAVQREMARKRTKQAVLKADVIITNPTHFAIAIQYDKDSMLAPKVVAKGADLMAQNIKKIAAEAGIPLVENVPLARTLYKTVKTGQYVPRALYQAVAEVLAYVYRLRRKDFT